MTPNPNKGCLALRERGHNDWQTPTFNEYKLMFGLTTIKNPLTGSYRVGDYANHKDASIIDNLNKILITGANKNNLNIKHKVRCIRDIKR